MAVVKPSIFFLVILLSSVSSVAKPADEPLSAVADLRYGVALYEYYQGEYMEALAELLVAKQRGGVQGHGDNPEIMEGGFALAYGMENYAGDIFERLLEGNRSVEARDAAWFYIARLRYLHEDWAGAQQALEHISKKPEENILNELIVLRINLAIKQNQMPVAEQILDDRKPEQGWLPYVYFNLGSAWARQQNYDAAIEYFNQLGVKQYQRDEHKALYDKAMTAAGYSYLFSGRHEEAISQFTKVRLNSPLSGRALLGYGWAAAEMENFEEALKPWEYLSRSSLIDENSQESLIAVPYAYEKLGAEGLALQKFQSAEARFVTEIATLEDVIANLQGDALLEALRIESNTELNWLKYAEENQLSPQLSYLIHLFSEEEFQQLAQTLRDLLAVQESLYRWQDKLDFYNAMLDEREFNRTEKTNFLAQQQLGSKIAAMEAQRIEMANRIAKISAGNDYFALANEDEADLVERVLRAKERVELLRETDPFIEENGEAVRRYYGLLLWNTSEQFSVRRWRVLKALSELDAILEQVKENYRSIHAIVGDAPDLDPYRVKMSQAQERLARQIVATDRTVENTKNELRNQVVTVLHRQRERLTGYLAQSRLAIARIYDKARNNVNQQSFEDQPDAQMVPQEDSATEKAQ